MIIAFSVIAQKPISAFSYAVEKLMLKNTSKTYFKI